MTANGTIDAARYPNFARLGRSAIWYPRATSVHEHTTGAVPAMLTGARFQNQATPSPTLTDHPNNLFTLLGDSHAYNAEETDTVLCPQRYCARRGAIRSPSVLRHSSRTRRSRTSTGCFPSQWQEAPPYWRPLGRVP